MSATASFYLIETAKLQELVTNAEIIVKKTLFSKKVTDNYWDYLDANATGLEDFEWSGYIIANLLIYLDEEKNIHLTESEYHEIAKELSDKRDTTHCIFTYQQKQAFADQLDPARYSLADLQAFNQDFSGEGDEETAKLSIKAIKLLRDNLNKVDNSDKVLLLIIG